MPIVVSQEKFINQCKKLHGDRYSYDKTLYVGCKRKIIITCSIHGDFEQIAADHKSGINCPRCSYMDKTITQEECIRRFRTAHKDKYDYKNTLYIGVNDPVKIICKIHGEFLQSPCIHWGGGRCKMCVSANKCYDIKKFIEKSNSVHNGKYDYSLVEYRTKRIKVKIICPIHGLFIQVAGAHMFGQGCVKCAQDKLRIDPVSAIDIASNTHNDIYDYSKSIYIDQTKKFEIICKTHGSFFANYINHVGNKSGCPGCARTGFDSTKIGIFYILKGSSIDDALVITKIGITHNLDVRLLDINRKCKKYGVSFSLYYSFSLSGTDTLTLENAMLEWARKNYQTCDLRFSGYTESFFDLNVDMTREIALSKIKEMGLV